MRVGNLVIPAAGLGRRMAHLREGGSKEMLDVGGRPAIDYALDEALDAGIGRIAVVIGEAKRDLRRHLEAIVRRVRKDTAVEIDLLVQHAPSGEADAIGLAEDFVGPEPLAIMYPDNICLPSPGALRSLTEAFESGGVDVVALTEVDAARAGAFANSGRVDLTPLGGSLYRIDRFHPKGEGTFPAAEHPRLRACGLWVAGPRLFPALHRARARWKGGEFTDGPVRDILVTEGEVRGLVLPGTFFDIGNPEGYRRCRAWFQGPKRCGAPLS